VRWEPVGPPRMISRLLKLALPPLSNLEEAFPKATGNLGLVHHTPT
jgi:hypothetical protein